MTRSKAGLERDRPRSTPSFTERGRGRGLSRKYGMGLVVIVGCPLRDNIPPHDANWSNLVLGIQHHLLAQLFLVQFDPSIPRVGTNRRAAMRKMTVSTNITWTSRHM